MYLTIAIAATLVALLFARDVTRSAHGAVSPRRSENRSFGTLANLLISQENTFDGRLSYLLSQGTSLSRPVFAARLTQLYQELPAWLTEAEHLRRPKLVNDVNDVIANSTEQRIDAYQLIFANLARQLSLTWPPTGPSDLNQLTPSQVLIQTSQQWGRERFDLIKQPGTVKLLALTTATAKFVENIGFAHLVSSSSLALHRSVSIAAVSVLPSPLPSAVGELVLPPVTSFHLGISVANDSFVTQPVVVRVVLTRTNGVARGTSTVHVLSVTIGPLQSYAFVLGSMPTQPSERATLVIRVTGSTAHPAPAQTRTYQVIMSPAGTG
jgi:hypothetical protein